MFGYWIMPLFSGVVWITMLLSLLIHWLTQGKPHYNSMHPDQSIPYVSDIGAEDFKPLFISLGATSVITFSFGFIIERYLRHKGRLVPNTSRGQKVLAVLAIIFSIVGATGLILLTIFDTLRHKGYHDLFITVFIGGFVVCAICTCLENQRLSTKYRNMRILKVSYRMKVAFILLGIGLVVAFGVFNRMQKWNVAACIEWVIGFLYTLWVSSFILDFLPSARPMYSSQGLATNPAPVPMSGGVANEHSTDRYGHDYDGFSGVHFPSGTTASGGIPNGWSHPGPKENGPRSMV